MSNYTKGPWVHADNGIIYGQCGEDDDEAPFICDVIEDSAMQALGILSPVEEANSRIIAAAPEMLALLKTLLENCALINKTGLDKTRYRKLVKELINKIEGE